MEISLLRHQSQLITLPFRHREIRHFFLVGGYGCVAGDTLIDTPNGKIRIDRFKGGEVYAWNPVGNERVVAESKRPVKLGKCRMVRLGLSNGKSIDCSLEHRFLCVDGNYRSVSELLSLFVSNHLLTTSEYDLLAHDEDASRLNRKPQDSLVCYPAYRRLCDELLHSEEDNDLSSFRRLADVQQHNHKEDHIHSFVSLNGNNKDVPQPKYKDILSSAEEHESKCCIDNKYEELDEEDSFVSHISATISVEDSALLQSLLSICQIYRVQESYLHKSSLSKVLSVLRSVLLHSYSSPYGIYIQTVTPISYNVKYDMHVPYYQNYITQGIVSHNCGKSFSDVMLIMELARRYPKLKPGAMFGVASLSGVLFTTTIGNTVEALCKETGIKYRLDKRDNIMYVGGARFKIFNLEDYTSIAGFNFSVVLMDELDELPQAKALGAYKACRERCRVTLPDGREPFMVTTTTAQGKRGIYKIIQDLKREIGIDGEGTKTCVIHGRTIDNTNNDPTYYQDLYRAYDEMERKAYLDGEFVSLESGRVYPKYSSDRNDCEDFEVGEYEDIYIGQDLNLGFSSAVACVVREGVIYVVKAYSFDDIWYAPETFRADYPTNSIEWFPDSSSKDIFSLHGYKQQISQQDIRTRISTVNPSIIARTAMVNILLRQGRIRVCRNKSTAHLREGLDMRGFDKKGNPEKGEGRDAYDHMTDSLEYVTFRLVQDRAEFSDIRRLRMVGQYRTLPDKQ